MPQVGSKHFSYGSKGMKAAKTMAKKTGKKVVMKKTTAKLGKPNTSSVKNITKRMERGMK